MTRTVRSLVGALDQLSEYQLYVRATGVLGMTIEVAGLGCKAEIIAVEPGIQPTEAWLGRVLNAPGEPTGR